MILAALRPRAARWFELVVAQPGLATALDALAPTGAVELQCAADTSGPTLAGLRVGIERYLALARRYAPYWAPYWPAPAQPSAHRLGPLQSLDRALEQLAAWQAQAAPWVSRLESLGAEKDRLQRIDDLLAALGSDPLDVGALVRTSAPLAARLWRLSAGVAPPALEGMLLVRTLNDPGGDFVLALGREGDLTAAETLLSRVRACPLSWPDELSGTAAQARAMVQARLMAIDRESDQLSARVHALGRDRGLAATLADLARLHWITMHAERLPVSEHFVWVSGWTVDRDGDVLRDALKRAGVAALLQFPPAPPEAVPPLVLANPRWVRPFELFTRLLGMPGAGEADPSRLLAIVVPLLFGYMFGDVGQGLVLAAAGAWARRRWPIARLLVPAGIGSASFGLAYGSVFGREDLIPALWLRPLDAPLLVLGIPIAIGAGLLALGLALAGIGAHWRGEGRRWRRRDAGLLAAYAGLLMWPVIGPWLALVGMAWFLGGSVAAGHGALGLARLAEGLFQLGVNTLSFARVGAFALAHAGLAAAVTALAAAAGAWGQWPVLLAGNALVILLEGTVVSVQVTRLMLFEFFIRFLRAEGRRFRPLPPFAGSRAVRVADPSSGREREASP